MRKQTEMENWKEKYEKAEKRRVTDYESHR